MSGEKNSFGYGYLANSHLPESLSMPNNMTLTRAYEEKRDLVTAMTYKRATTTVVNRGYTYDALARPTTRTTARKGSSRNDAFTYNSRSELAAATLGTDGYGYDYDNIGNRKTAQELAGELTYASNNLNQYTGITLGEGTPFVPAYDANGNQTLVKTATGIWTVQYDANNRPVSFTRAEGENTTVVECGYDYLGRRYMKKVTVNGTVTLHHRYIYRGYLQIACCDLTRAAHPCLWLITWDPTEPAATRPLAIQKDGTWYCYGLDITKNVWELFGADGYIRTAYDYIPYGSVTAEGNASQPVQWSSEVYDEELALVYYNYRHYNPMDGRWISRDPKQGISLNLYLYITLQGGDLIGLSAYKIDDGASSFHPTPDKGSGTHLSEPLTLRDVTIASIIKEILPYYGLKYPRAANHLGHYLNNTGSTIHLNPADFKDNEDYCDAIKNELSELGKFAAGLPEKGKNYPIVSTASTVGYFSKKKEDLFYAIGGFHIWGEGNICVNDNKYVAELTIHFYDSYNWDKGKQTPIPLPTAILRWMVEKAVGTTGPIRIEGNQLIVKDEALARLHRQGLAKEFEIKGQETIRIEGIVGETSGTVSRGGGR